MADLRRACLLLTALVVAAVPAMANHVQTEAGRTVTFDHKTGNEWWVEVLLSGPDAATVGKVQGMDTNGPWVDLPKQSWGAYAASFHIEPGNLVRFRALWADGDVVTSCWFTHPDGAERCDPATTSSSASPSPTPSPSPSTSASPSSTGSSTSTTAAFDARFTGVRGNEWWQQASVSATGGTLSKVDVRLDSGPFQPLGKQSWGGWAASYHAVQGTVVQFRATSSAGAVDLSDCYLWIPPSNADATLAACPGTSGTSTSTSASSTSSSTSSTSTTSSPPPQRAWTSRALAAVPGFTGGVVAGDVTGDGKGEVFVLGENGLYLVDGTASTLLDERPWWQGLVADADNDGHRELYAFGMTLNGQADEIRRLSFANGAITQDRLVYSSADFSGPFAVADLDGDGLDEVYVGKYVGGSASLWRTDFNGTYHPPVQVLDLGNGGGYRSIAALQPGTVGGRPALAILTAGDDDADGIVDDTLQLAHWSPSGYTASPLGSFLGGPGGLVVGDVDRDGAADVAASNGTVLRVYHPGAATTLSTAVPGALMDLAFGDVDGDGKPDLLATSDDHHLYQVAPTASGLQAKAIAAQGSGDDLGPFALALGNGDADADVEVYTLVYEPRSDFGVDSRLYEASFAVAQAPFDATFTGVKGNEWWVQASVAANQPVAGVDARVDCGAWHALALQGWGGWAASFHVPTGSKVDLRASTSSGQVDLSGGYVWPNATPTTPC